MTHPKAGSPLVEEDAAKRQEKIETYARIVFAKAVVLFRELEHVRAICEEILQKEFEEPIGEYGNATTSLRSTARKLLDGKFAGFKRFPAKPISLWLSGSAREKANEALKQLYRESHDAS